jgi:hypothetical protein
MPEQCSLVRMTLTHVSLKTKAFTFSLIKLDARPSARSERVNLDLDQIWLYLMELPAAKTVPVDIGSVDLFQVHYCTVSFSPALMK